MRTRADLKIFLLSLPLALAAAVSLASCDGTPARAA